MNSGMTFQMPGLSSTANSNTSSTAKADTRSSGSESFKKEMDKAYDKTENSEPANRKDVSKPSDTKDKTQNDKPVAKDEIEVEQTPQVEESDKEIISQALVLEATVAQLALLNQAKNENLGEVLSEAMGLTVGAGEETSLDGDGISIFDKLSKAESTEDGSILLPELKSNEDVLAEMKKVLKEDDGSVKITGMGTSEMKEPEQESQTTQLGKEARVPDLDGLKSQETSLNADGEMMPQENLSSKTALLDATKVNIKVAEAPVDTLKANIAEQLADKIMYKLSQGKQEFELELNPRNLGKINIKMTFENGNAELVMSSSNSKAHQLLANQTEALKAILEGRTGMDSSVNVKQPEANENQFDRDNFQEQNRGQQNQKQQKEERRVNENISFMERLRLGLIDGFEEAV